MSVWSLSEALGKFPPVGLWPDSQALNLRHIFLCFQELRYFLSLFLRWAVPAALRSAARPGTNPTRISSPMEPHPPPQAPADPGRPAARREERAGPCEPLAAAAALGEDRWGERQRSVRLSARPQPRRGGSPSSPPCAPHRTGNHGVQRGGRRRQRRGGGEGEWQEEEEAGRPGHDLAHFLQRRHDRGVSGRGRQRGSSAGRGAAERGRRGRGEAGAGRENRDAGEPPGAGFSSPARHCLIRCSAQPPARHPAPAAEVKYSRDRNAGRGSRVPRHGPGGCGGGCWPPAGSRLRSTVPRGLQGRVLCGAGSGRCAPALSGLSPPRLPAGRAVQSRSGPARERSAGTAGGGRAAVAQEIRLSLCSVLRGFAVGKEGIVNNRS